MIVKTLPGQRFDRAMNDLNLVLKGYKASIVAEAQVQTFHEMLIQFDAIEPDRPVAGGKGFRG